MNGLEDIDVDVLEDVNGSVGEDVNNIDAQVVGMRCNFTLSS